MAIKIGINGMGRIGRMVVRSIYENHKGKIQVKHINNRSGSEVCANLLKYDSVHGKFNAEIKSNSSYLKINKDKISFSQFSNIQDINWKKYNVDYVFECTGKFNSKEKLLPHLKNGAKKVIVSAPCKNADRTVVFGVNHRKILKNDNIGTVVSIPLINFYLQSHQLKVNYIDVENFEDINSLSLEYSDTKDILMVGDYRNLFFNFFFKLCNYF